MTESTTPCNHVDDVMTDTYEEQDRVLCVDTIDGMKPDEKDEAVETVGLVLDKTSQSERKPFKERLISDGVFRRKFLLWICLCMSSFTMGWTIGQLGPSLLDLKEITRVELDAASFFLTSMFIGYLTGTISSGAVFDRMNPYLFLFIGVSCMGITSAAIPWCSFYELMLFMHILKGIGFGILDTAGNSVFISKFKDEKEIHSYLQTIHLMFAVGGFLSPIATAPFLMEIDTITNNTTNVSVISLNSENCSALSTYCLYSNAGFYRKNLTNVSAIISHNDFNDTTVRIENKTSRNDSILYQAYLISAVLCVLLAIPFLLMSVKDRGTSIRKSSADGKPKRKLPLKLKFVILVLMCVFLGVDNGFEDTMFGLFSAFLVRELGWTKQKGSYAVSVYWASFAVGRLCAIYIGPKLKSSKLLRYYILIFLLGLTGLLISAVFGFDIGIWISFPIMGFAVSVFFPGIFLWIEEDFMSVTGRVSSCLLVSASLGSMINPIFIGYLMDDFDPMWFLYIAMADGVAMFIMVWTATYIARYTKQYRVCEKPKIETNENENTHVL